MGRTSTSSMARTNGWAPLGLMLVRCAFANHRPNRPSPARLGTKHGGHGLGAPQPVELGQERLGGLGRDPDRVVVAGHALGRGMHQDQGAGALGSGAGEEDRRRVQFGQDRGLLAADRIQHRAQLLGIGRPGRQGIEWQRVGGAGAPTVEQDHPGKGRQRAQEQGEPGVFPGGVEVAKARAGHDQVGWALAEDLVGDPVAAQPGIGCLRLHGPSSHPRSCRDSRPPAWLACPSWPVRWRKLPGGFGLRRAAGPLLEPTGRRDPQLRPVRDRAVQVSNQLRDEPLAPGR
jgi:hypothetical protein